MKYEELRLFETPLPEDWDEAIFSDRTAFVNRVKYAKERAKQIGRGSGRTAFLIPYQGRDTVLKVASNTRGTAQNSVEVEILTDGFYRNQDILIPIIDYDTKNAQPTWIHVERASKLRSSRQFETLTGFTLDDIAGTIDYISGRRRMPVIDGDHPAHESELFNSVLSLANDFGMPGGDFSRIANWGLWRGKPVILDVGLTTDVYDQHYRRV